MQRPLVLSIICLLSFLSSCSTASRLPAELTIEEHALATQPEIEPLSFQPLQGTQDEILSKHAAERQDTWQVSTEVSPPRPLFVFPGDEALRISVTSTETESSEQPGHYFIYNTVHVFREAQEIYSQDLGRITPLENVRGIWSHSGHWFLEVVQVNADREPWQITGMVIKDGVSLNEHYGYEESFGFQLIHNQPFYFYKQNGQIGISYHGQNALLEYAQVPHYGCCSITVLNPIAAKDMVAFFAESAGQWYYVEIGVFDE